MLERGLIGWNCPRCNYPNEADVVSCAICDMPKPNTESYIDLLQQDDEYERMHRY